MAKTEHDEITGTATTGHEWDGIKELNTPLPRWWIYTFYATVVWALAYTIAYPAWPLIRGATPGILGYSSRADLVSSVDEARGAQKAQLDQIAAASLDDILKDPGMLAFARAGGAAAFKINCVQCHGSGAQGGPGFPNLNDDSWLWGGKPDQVVQTISNGIRDTSNGDTRDSIMPNFGKDGLLEADKITAAANYVRQIANLEHDAAAATAGATVFAENCASCHGEKGEGNQDLGAPQLNDAVWLYSDSLEGITAQVNAPRHGMMPGWNAKLGEGKVKALAAYVLSLGGGQ